MKKFEAECALGFGPQRVVMAKADRLILVVRQVAQKLRRQSLRRALRRTGKRTRAAF
jgi:hypothetical protein